MRFLIKKIKKRFGESKIKRLSLHPLLQAVVLKSVDYCEESFLRIRIMLLSLQSAKTEEYRTEFFENIEVRNR
jgi:hypothetical protein